MSPAALHALVDVDNWARAEAERTGGHAPVSKNPATDLMSLAQM